tara:strand:+ start:253 stop:423 length:171 start_codon:yes stop_codon:yes gene_type:complete
MKYILLAISVFLIFAGIMVNVNETSVGAERIGFLFGSLGPGVILSFITLKLFKKTT